MKNKEIKRSNKFYLKIAVYVKLFNRQSKKNNEFDERWYLIFKKEDLK